MSKSSISYLIFSLLLFATSLQYSSWGIEGTIYEVLRAIIIGAIVLLFLVSLKNPLALFKKIPVFKVHSFCLVLFSFLLFILYALGVEVDFTAVRDLALALVILTIGLNINLKEKQFIRLINIYIVLYTLAAVSLVTAFASGFEIQERYLPIPKNQVAPAFGVAFMLSVYFSFIKKGTRKWFYYIFIALLGASLLVIRGRAVIVAVMLAFLVFIFYYIRNKKYIFFTLAFVLLLMPFIWQYLYDALFLNYDITDIDSISTNRMTRNLIGIDFLLKYPLTGQLGHTFYGRKIHNYVLISLVSYGALLSSLILIIYFKYVLKIIRAIRKNTFQYYEVGPLVMIILLIISLFEYTYPYAPGSAVFFPFFLLGQYLKKRNS